MSFVAEKIEFKVIQSDESDLSDKSDASDRKDNDGQFAKNYWAARRVSKAAKFPDGTDDL